MSLRETLERNFPSFKFYVHSKMFEVYDKVLPLLKHTNNFNLE